MKLGFIGLGRMGASMAAHLCQASYDLTVFNRSAERLQPLINLEPFGIPKDHVKILLREIAKENWDSIADY